MLPERTPLWVVLFTSPLSGLVALVPTMLVMEVWFPTLGLYLRREMPNLYIVGLATVMVAMVWFVHHKMFMKDFRRTFKANEGRRH